MLASDVYPPGVPCWIDSAQPEPEEAASFYSGLFGWEFENRMPSDSADRYLVARRRGRDVAAIRPVDDLRPAWTTYLCVEDAAQSAARASAAGAKVVAAGRATVLADPAGAVFGVWEPDGIRGAQLVNASNTWNFSDLTTPDPDGAKAFYGEVFGWEARPVRMGGAEIATMWCLPGYGETQDAKEPGFLQRHAEAGTPEGFTDAFGWLQPPTDAQLGASAPASWNVTFAVDDTEATATRAAHLGGTITVAPTRPAPPNSQPSPTPGPPPSPSAPTTPPSNPGP